MGHLVVLLDVDGHFLGGEVCNGEQQLIDNIMQVLLDAVHVEQLLGRVLAGEQMQQLQQPHVRVRVRRRLQHPTSKRYLTNLSKLSQI